MNLINVLNTIRANASASYQERIPQATQDNLEDIQALMVDGDNVQVANEFMNTLINKLVKSVVHTKTFTNPLKMLKKGTKPYGDTVEEIYTNFLKGNLYDPTGADFMSRNLPDTKTIYHRKNYSMQYSITVNRKDLKYAFSSYENLERYITSIIERLTSSAELDEFKNIKHLCDIALQQGAIKKVHVKDPLNSEADGKEFIKTVKTISGLMPFPSTEFNGYLNVQSSDTKPIETFTLKNEQVLILDVPTSVSLDIDVLASIFNMSVAQFNDTKKIVIDSFEDPNVRALLIDEAFLPIYDDFTTVTNWFNPKGIYTNYYLTIDQTYAYSPLVNAVAFCVASDADGDGVVEQVGISIADTLISTNKATSIDEGATYTTTITVNGSTIFNVTVGSPEGGISEATSNGTSRGNTATSSDGKVTIKCIASGYDGDKTFRYRVTVKEAHGNINVSLA